MSFQKEYLEISRNKKIKSNHSYSNVVSVFMSGLQGHRTLCLAGKPRICERKRDRDWSRIKGPQTQCFRLLPAALFKIDNRTHRLHCPHHHEPRQDANANDGHYQWGHLVVGCKSAGMVKNFSATQRERESLKVRSKPFNQKPPHVRTRHCISWKTVLQLQLTWKNKANSLDSVGQSAQNVAGSCGESIRERNMLSCVRLITHPVNPVDNSFHQKTTKVTRPYHPDITIKVDPNANPSHFVTWRAAKTQRQSSTWEIVEQAYCDCCSERSEHSWNVSSQQDTLPFVFCSLSQRLIHLSLIKTVFVDWERNKIQHKIGTARSGIVTF